MTISHKLVALIESNADKITKAWLKEVKDRKETPTYAQHDEERLYHRAFRVYRHLGEWISRERSKEEIARHYLDLGRRRKRQGFALSEVVAALIIARRMLWVHVLTDAFLETALEMNQALELSNRVVLFFDRATYYASRGYEEPEKSA